MDLPRNQQPQFTAAEYSFPGVCYAFQSNTCTNSPCSRAHWMRQGERWLQRV